MWLQFAVACVLAVLGGASVALAFSRLRESGKELSRKLQAHSDLVKHLAERDEKLRECAATIASLQGVMSARKAQSEAAGKRSRELEQASRAHAEAHAEKERALEARAAELEAELAARGGELQKLAAEAERLGRDVADALRDAEGARRDAASAQRDAADARGEAAGVAQRAAELELELGRRAEQEAERARRAAELESSLAGRVRELEVALADRDAELRTRDAELAARGDALDLARGELAAKAADSAAAAARCAELESGLAALAEAERERSSQERELDSVRARRTADLEERIAERDASLRDQTLAVQRLQDELAAKSGESAAAAGRAAELEAELARGAERERERDLTIGALQGERAEVAERRAALEQELERRAAREQQLLARAAELESALVARGAELERADREREQASAAAARLAELEGLLAGREHGLQQLRGECAALSDQCRAASDAAALRGAQIEEREREIARLHGHVEALEYAVQSGHEEQSASEALVDVLVQQRLAGLLGERAALGASSLPGAYLDGLAAGDLELALGGLLGGTEPLSAPAVARLGERWERERAAWKATPLAPEVAYLWAAGHYLEAGSPAEDAALLAVVAAFNDGSRAVLAVESGDPRSGAAWLAILRELSARGMNVPQAVIAAGACGVWSALGELGWDCAEQHCWSHATAQVLAALPERRRVEAAGALDALARAESRAAAKELRDKFVKRCGVRCADAGELVCADWKALTRHFAFPGEHWPHLRTADVVGAPLAALGLRAAGPKPGTPAANAAAFHWKFLTIAARSFPRLDALQRAPAVALP